jgi:hypothetical protein
MPTPFMLTGHVDRFFALQLGALEDTVSFVVAFDAQSLLLVSLALLRSQSSSDGVEIKLATA